jgi:hypothetical protein
MGTIYLRHGDQFLAMHEEPYTAEALLQALLADHPVVFSARFSGARWKLHHF